MADQKWTEKCPSLVTTYGPNSSVLIIDPDASPVTRRILVSDLLLGPTTPPPSWAPTDLTGLNLWVSDEAGSFYTNSGLTTPATTNGDAVAGWKRSTGGAVDIINVQSNAGVYRPGTLNTHATVEIANNTTLGASGLTIARGSWYAALVYKTTNTSPTATLQMAFSVGDNVNPGANYAYLFPREDIGGGTIQTRAGQFAATLTVAGDVGAGYAIYEMGFDGTSFKLRVNGGTWQTGASSAFTTAERVGVGCFYRYGGASATALGNVAEAYLCDSWPDNTNLAASLDYLQTRFAL